MTLLTIPDEVTSQAYTVTTAQTVFPFSFAVFTKADLRFSVAGAELAQTDFTLSGALLDGGGYQGGTVTLNVAVSNCACLLWRETVTARTDNFSPTPAVPVRDIDVSLNRLTAMVQDQRRDLIAGGLGLGATGVASVNGKVGIVTLTATDVGCVPSSGGAYSGAVTGVTAVGGDNSTKLATTAWVTTAIAALGGGVNLATSGTPADLGTASRGVGTTAARSDHVHNLPTLTALGAAPAALTTKGDLYTFGSSALRLPVGSNAQIVVADSTQTSGLRWTNLDWSIVLGKPSVFPPAAHTHVYTDVTNFGSGVNASLAAGAGVTLGLSGGVTTISASGSLAYLYVPAWENGITTGNTATTNITNLNSLISTLSASGGGEIEFNAPGPYQINATVNLKDNVSLNMKSGAYFSWSAGGSGNILESPAAGTMTGVRLKIAVNEGGSFSGCVLRLHSGYHNDIDIHGLGSNTGSTFMHISADSSGGSGMQSDRNFVANRVRAIHTGVCGTFALMDGIASGLGGNPQVVTLNDFVGFQGAAVYFRGIKLESWTDTNTFVGNHRLNITGFGGVGMVVNEGRSGTPSVYNIRFDQLAIDTFGTGLSRTGVALFESKGIYCDAFYQGPVAENGDFTGTACTSYQFRKLITTGGGTDNIYVHQKNISSGL